MTLKPGQSSFKGLEGYRFIDPASSFESYSKDLLDVRLNQDGKAQSSVTLPRVQNAPGMLTANILCSVMEDGGDESYTTLTMPYSPYSAYVGAKLPSDGDYLETGKTHNIPVAVVDCNGRRVSGHTIEWRIFKLKWSWWWESRRDPLDSYINASAASAFSSGRTTSGSGDINIPFSAMMTSGEGISSISRTLTAAMRPVASYSPTGLPTGDVQTGKTRMRRQC